MGEELILTEVWEAYERDSQRCVMYLTEEQARNQNVFGEVDLIAKANVYLSKAEIEKLKQGIPVRG